MDPIITPLVGIAGGLMVAIAQYIFLRRTNKEGKLSDRTATAYSDYLGAVARMINPYPARDYEAMNKAVHQLADAKCRIVVYGDQDVVEAMSAFARLGDRLETKEQRDAFLAIVRAMRQGNGADSEVTSEGILPILFGHSAHSNLS